MAGTSRWSCALILAGYGLTLLVFYPGVMTYDAKYVYEDIAKSVLGDWQSPAMTVLWRLINPIAPGSGSMFLLIMTAYWLAFGILAFALARRSIWLAVLLPLLALTPPAFVFAGIIWRDVLFSVTWLLAGSIAFVAVERGTIARLSLQALALALCGFGVLLRPNALIAAPLLAAYAIWPTQFGWKRTAIMFVPAMAVFFGLVQVVYYGALGAVRQHPLQSIMVFDLGGISHFSQQNQFPVRWNEAETRAAPERLLQADRVGHLLDAHAVPIRDAKTGKGRKAVRHAGRDQCLGQRHRAPSGCLP